jgi:2-isopropylmalate synthase
MDREKIHLYDTTLRDGAQGEGIAFSIEDKLAIAHRLDELGIDTIEGGFAGSSPKDQAFFQRILENPLAHARIAAFGMTRRSGVQPENDPRVQAVLETHAAVATLVGKSWDFHVTQVLKVSLSENLAMIEDTVRLLKAEGMDVVYDAEHFFDGYRQNQEYALETLRAARTGGASGLVLCDTNGGTLPGEVADLVARIRSELGMEIGIHTHNDAELGVANTLMGVLAGARHVQGTMNGFGERCGNANLASIIPNLQLKMGFQCVSEAQLATLTEVSHFVDEVANMVPRNSQPYVGRSAFAHKGGLHGDAMAKHQDTYEHIRPGQVGNETRLVVSEQSGTGTIARKLQVRYPHLTKSSEEVRQIYDEVLVRDAQGYCLEGAEASLDLIVRKALGTYRKLFELLGYRVIVEQRSGAEMITEATLKLAVDGDVSHTVAEGDGPVHALDGALRRALTRFYPELAHIKLTDYKVRVLNDSEGTAARVRVLINTADEHDSWSTAGVSTNIIEASWEAVVDSIEYGLLKRMDAAQSAQSEESVA